MLHNSHNSYGWVSIFFHWISAFAVIGLFAVGFWMVDLSYYSEWYKTAPHYHKSVGVLLLVITVARFAMKLKQTSPKPLGNTIEVKVAHLAHLILYGLLLLIFISGYLISTADGRGIEIFNWVTLPGAGELFSEQEDTAGFVHRWLAYGLMAMVVLHALAAIKHHFINKDSTLKRMLKPLTPNL